MIYIFSGALLLLISKSVVCLLKHFGTLCNSYSRAVATELFSWTDHEVASHDCVERLLDCAIVSQQCNTPSSF